MTSGLISNIQKYSLQDGPGIRTTVFLKGCPLDCWWCHNPENRASRPEVAVVESRCIRCGECLKVCPQSEGASLGPEGVQPPVECKVCGGCVEVCPTGARQLVGRRLTAEQALAELLADRIFYEESGGGITFSGGEPLMQPEFLKDLLTACRAQGINTAVDTCGFAPREQLLAVAALTDLFLYDLKFVDDAKHREYTGVSNATILENLQALSGIHKNIWIRIPIIPGLNDCPEELEAMARLVASLSGVQQVNLLPYHKTGIHKFKRLGQNYRLADTVPPSREYMEAVAQRFNALGLNAKAGG